MELKYGFITLLVVLLKLARLCSPRKFDFTLLNLSNFMASCNFTEEISIFHNRPSLSLPDISLRPTASTVLVCGLIPTSLEYRTRWITPAEEILVSTTGRHVVINEQVTVNGTQFPGTTIAIEDLSYQDAGQYVCEGQTTNTTDPSIWISASIHLQLNGKFIYTSKDWVFMIMLA